MASPRASASDTFSCATISQIRIRTMFDGCTQEVRSSQPAALRTSEARDAVNMSASTI
jgi:hypothetical protein